MFLRIKILFVLLLFHCVLSFIFLENDLYFIFLPDVCYSREPFIFPSKSLFKFAYKLLSGFSD